MVVPEGAGRATRYKIREPYDVLRGDALTDAVITALWKKYSGDEG